MFGYFSWKVVLRKSILFGLYEKIYFYMIKLLKKKIEWLFILYNIYYLESI